MSLHNFSHIGSRFRKHVIRGCESVRGIERPQHEGAAPHSTACCRGQDGATGCVLALTCAAGEKEAYLTFLQTWQCSAQPDRHEVERKHNGVRHYKVLSSVSRKENNPAMFVWTL
ncbi:hypothetical protein Mapa_003901 [Marchantia paleacea]|nr:hypothetical protein Mapa_003901 [Marchantia paleacea]